MQDNILKCLGLVTQYNPLSTAPGALIQADDCVVRRENVIENRRGYTSYMTLSSAPSQLFVYSRRILAHHGSTISYDSNGSGTSASFSGSYSAPSGYKSRSVEANSNLYFTTSQGVKAATSLSTASGTIRACGAPRSLDASYALNAAASGFLDTSYQCAYRIVIKRTDANSNVLFGYPSTRLVAYNTAATSKNVDITLYLPSEITTSDVIQVYRTAKVSGTGSDLSGDEMALVYQVNPTSAEVAALSMTFTDSVIDELRGATLYTSPSQEGITAANERPPLAKDIALYKSQYMFFANTSTKQRLYLTLVGTGSLSGNTITLGGITYNFGATEIISGAGSPQVQVFTAGIASVNIDNTARSLVRVINRYASNTSIYAYYLSGPDDLPGMIMIEERGIGASAFTVQASNTAISGMFFPAPPVSPATSTASTSTNSIQKNALYYSKAQQPEHVPAANYIPVGPSNTEILRIAPLRDSLIIIKEEGVYRLTGESAPFTVTPLDLTVYCKALDSVAVLANQVFMLSNQGVVSISDTGVQVVSREVEPSLLPLLSYSNTDDYAFGFGYESERLYHLSVPGSSLDTSNTQTFVFNIFTRTWTRYTYGVVSAMVEPSTDKLFLIKADQSKVYRERKDFTDADYSDPDQDCTITSISGSTIVFTTSGDVPVAGWAISQAGSAIVFSSVSSSGSTHTVTLVHAAPASWTTGAAILKPCIQMEVIWDAWSAGQPGLLKHVRQLEVLTDNITGNSSATALFATFRTDIDPNEDEIQITSAAYRWGSAPWGSTPWGGQGDTYAYPTYVPRNKQYCRIMNPGVAHRRSGEKLSINGLSFTFEIVSERVGK